MKAMSTSNPLQVAAQKYANLYPELREADDLRKAVSRTQGLCGRFSPMVDGCQAFWIWSDESRFEMCDNNHEPYRHEIPFERFLEALAEVTGGSVGEQGGQKQFTLF
jgi:hypothetical protein